MTIGIVKFLIVTLTNFCVVFCLILKGAPIVARVETVSPTILFSKGHGVFPRRVVYMIAAEKKTFVLNLRRNRELLPYNFRLDLGNGKTSRTDKHSGQCYYQGRIRDLDRHRYHSRATVSTCGGLHGVFEDENFTYFITPHNFSNTHHDSRHTSLQSLHFLYNMTEISENNTCVMNCKSSGETFLSGIKERIEQQSRPRQRRDVYGNSSDIKKLGPKTLPMKTKYIELYLVNDYSMYLHYGKNSTFLEHRSKLIANILDARFRPLKIRIVLVGVEVWTSKNRVEIVDDSMQTLLNFLQYRSRHINRRYRNDNAQLITRNKLDHGTTAGKAPVSTICSWRYSGGVNQDAHNNPLYVATVMAHELGHNLGMQHDSSTSCSCNDHAENKCIMNHALDASVRSFSSCSRKYLRKTLANGQGHCLGRPKDETLLPTCGNGIVEEDEECDCGTVENCMKMGNCCNPDTCMLQEGAKCTNGKCCKNCQFKQGGSICREKSSECDLPEYCTGYSRNCPKDVHIQDGYTCLNGSSYCHSGMCLTHDLQCGSTYGNHSRSSHPSCYTLLNARGNEEGNCGKQGERYRRCPYKHSMCGSLQCRRILKLTNIFSRDPVLGCLTNQSHKATERNISLTTVLNGTRCGDGRVCLNQKCVTHKVFRAQLNMRPCPMNCSYRGVCNSNFNCHCDPGWAPPHCDRPGNGGSIDSGQPMSLKKYENRVKRLRDIGKPVIAMITVGLVCAIVFALAVTKFSFRQICRRVTKREQQRNRIPRGELLNVLERH